MNNIKLPIFANSPQTEMHERMLSFGIDMNGPTRCFERNSALNCLPHIGRLKISRFFDRLLPQVNRRVGRLHRITDDAIIPVFTLKAADKILISFRFDALKITPRRIMPLHVEGPNTSQFFFTHTGRDHRNLICCDPLIQ